MSTPSPAKKLAKLASKQAEWSSLDPGTKLSLLQEIKGRLGPCPHFANAANRCVTETMGIPLHTVEGIYRQSEEMLTIVTTLAITLDYLILSYKVMSGQQPAPDLPKRQLSNGQWIVQVFPLLTDEKFGPLAKAKGEVYLDPDKVKTKEDIQLFKWKTVQQNGQGPGAAVVLGAGNFGLLTIGDCFSVLFRQNRVALVKHHPLHAYADDYLRFVLAPLHERGYVDFCFDEDFDRQLVYSNDVALVHMTGGKATHDTIVWGPTEKERADRRRRKTPLLQAQMSSELGCVTPWIVPQCFFTEAELKAQALNIARSVKANCSFACNSPKVLIVSSEWKQRDQFVDLLLDYFKTHTTPVAYYPSAKERWEAFRDHASPQYREIGMNLDASQRELSAPLLQKEPVLLPYLINPIEIDMTTPEGMKENSKYALENEPFCPALTICTLRTTGKMPEDYLEMAVGLCNTHIFGSLSASMSAPSSMRDDPSVSSAVQSLKYGTVALNGWSAFAYGMKGLPWGAHPGETLEAVESGIGAVNQYCFIDHVVKGVVTLSNYGMPELFFPSEETLSTAAVNRAIAHMVQKPGIFSILRLLWCLLTVQVLNLLKSIKVW